MLYYLRLIVLIPLILFLGFMGFLLCLFSPFNPRIMIFISRIISHISLFILNIKVEIRGRNNLDKNTPCIIISNHQSNLDVVFGGLIAPLKTVSLGKKEIRRIPIYGMFYWLSGNILIDRSKKLKAVEIMDNAVTKALKKGISIWILPEGTRSYSRGLLPFKRGAFRTVIHAQVPLIPVVMSPQHTTLDLKKFRPGRVIVEILEPIMPQEMSLENDKELTRRCEELFAKRLPELEKEVNPHTL